MATIRLNPSDLAQTRTDLGLTIGTDVLAPNGSAANLTAIPAAQITGTLPAINGGSVTDLNATNLGSGTVPDGRFPATLPATSGVNLTALNATNLGTGTVPDGRLPANLQSFPAPGSDGNVLTAASGAWTSAAAGGGGAWSVKTSGTFSSTTALEVTNITKTTIVYYTAISQTQNSVGLRTSSDNGSSYDSTAGDYNLYGAYSTNSALSNFHSTSFTSMFIQGGNAPDANGFLAGWFMLVQPADTNTKTIVLSMCCSEDAGTTGQQFYNMAGVRDTAAAVNAIKMFHPGVTSSFVSGSFVVCELN